MPRKALKKTKKPVYTLPTTNYLGKIENDLKSNQSKLSMVLGGLIVLVVGILVFNYFNKSQPALGPAQQTQQEAQEDVSTDKLPGKYTVKQGDTLFLIAEKYYKDGNQFDLIAKANNLNDVNTIEAGQVIEIPKQPETEALASPTSSPEVSPTPEPSSPTEEVTPNQNTPTDLGTGGADTTVWGSKIEGNTYTVAEGDWLSTISARAYGDIFSYQKIVEANNIQDPNYIVPGQVLKIPR